MSERDLAGCRHPVVRVPSVRVRAQAVDIGQLFATVERALERRRMNCDNRRLVWELQTINEIADGIARSLELERRARPARCSA